MERLPEEILHDPEYTDKFVAVKEVRTYDGRRMGEVLASGNDSEEVFSKLRQDRERFPDCAYYFARPIESGSDDRHHWYLKGSAIK